MIDLERYNREKLKYLEDWKTPVQIQFGAVFEAVTGDLDEPLYSLGIVVDIGSGTQFKGAYLFRGEKYPNSEENLPDRISVGGDWYRTHILRMTGEVLTPEQFIRGYRESFLQPKPEDPEDEYWDELRQVIDKWIKKGSRILTGFSK